MKMNRQKLVDFYLREGLSTKRAEALADKMLITKNLFEIDKPILKQKEIQEVVEKKEDKEDDFSTSRWRT